jgi:hypothetical protein
MLINDVIEPVIPVLAPPNCRPALQIRHLYDAGKLRNFVEESLAENTDGMGNCHEASLALMTDLVIAREAARWKWATGYVLNHHDGDGIMKHSWLECDGWALDCANGHMVFVRKSEYRQWYKASDVKTRDASTTKRWLFREAGRVSMPV